MSPVIEMVNGFDVTFILPDQPVKLYPVFGVAVSSTIVPSICSPLAGVIVPAVEGVTDVVSVYLITGASSSVSDEQDTTNKTESSKSIFLIGAKIKFMQTES
jgi:hypothetical protein